MIRELLLWGPPRSVRRAAVCLALAVVLMLAIQPAAFHADHAVVNDGYALTSLNTALAHAYCDRPYHLSTRFNLPVAIMNDDALRYLPLPQVIDRLSGSLADYCASVYPQFNNENSLLLLEAGMMTVYPGISVAQIGRVLHAIRVAAILASGWLLLVLGGSVLMAAFTIAVMLGLLDVIRAQHYSNYPFLSLMVVSSATLYGMALHRRWLSSLRGAVVVGLAAGLLAAFTINLRSSYLPIVVVHVACFLAAELLMAWDGPRRWRPAAIMAGAFLAVALAYQVVLISRFFPGDARQTQYHSVAHPLVLALSTPPNDLSRELDIRWLDDVGIEKALRVDPEAHFLGPRYDPALFAYYRSLWSTRPRQMLEVYLLKFAAVGPDMLVDLRQRPWWIDVGAPALLAPISWLPNGLWLLGLYAAITVAAAARFVRLRRTVAFVVVLLGTAAVLLQVEAGMIYSLWVPHYHGYLAFAALLVSLAGVQGLLNGGVLVFAKLQRSPHFEVARTEGHRFLGLPPAGHPRSRTLSRMASALVQFGLMALLLVTIVPASWLTLERSTTADRAAAADVDAALGLALCGSVSAGGDLRIGADAILDPAFQLTPFRTLVEQRVGSIAAYCARAAAQPAHIGLMTLLNAAILKVRPAISAAGLGKSLHYARLAAAAAVTAAMLAMGFSPALASSAFAAHIWVLVTLRHHLFSGASLAPLLAMTTVVLLAWLAARARSTRPGAPLRVGWVIAALCGTGFVIVTVPALAFVEFVCVLVFLATVFTDMGGRLRASHGTTGCVVLFVATVIICEAARSLSSASLPLADRAVLLQALVLAGLMALQTALRSLAAR